MKSKIILILLCLYNLNAHSQISRIAILDFDNISGIAKYDGLGKALSSMLISDIESNVSSKRLQLVERAQLNKIIKEQNLQKTSSFDKNTSVKLGKLLGVKYLLLGDIFVLDNALVINARLTDVSSGDIKFSEKQEGKINEWLSIKTKLAKSVNTSLLLPFTEPRIPDVVISPALLTTYANAIDENDKGNYEKAETLINTAKDFDPKFAYLDELRIEVEKLKKRFEKLEVQVETSIENPIAAAINFNQKNDFKTGTKYLLIGLSRLNNKEYGKKYIYYRLLTENYYLDGDYIKSIAFADSIFRFYTYDDNAIYFKSLSLARQNKIEPAISLIKNQLSNFENAWSKAEFSKQIQRFEDETNYEFSGIDIDPMFDNPFQISIDGNATYKGEYFQQGDFIQQLNRYIGILEYLKNTPIQVAESVNSLRLKGKPAILPLFKIDKPFYLPSSRYSSRKTKGKELVYVENGQNYIGDYFLTFDGKKYSGVSPTLCPCKILYTTAEYDQFIKAKNNNTQLTLDFFLERQRVFTLGWYYLLAKNPDNSIAEYSKLLEFYKQFLSSYQKFQSLSSLDKNSMRMSEINIGHSFLYKKDFENALIHYNKSGLDREFYGSNGKTSKEVIIDDWNDLVQKGIFTKKIIDDFKLKSNNIFK